VIHIFDTAPPTTPKDHDMADLEVDDDDDDGDEDEDDNAGGISGVMALDEDEEVSDLK